jgi:LemA protein
VVRDLNTLVQSFPSNLVAGAMGFSERSYFQLDEGERAAPRVEFGGGGAVAGSDAEAQAPASSNPAQTG